MTWTILFLLLGPTVVWLLMEIRYRRRGNATRTIARKDNCWVVLQHNVTVFKHIDKHVVEDWLDYHG